MKSFGLNDGRPNGEIVVEVDDNGAVTSARNVITNTEYVGGGGGGDFSTAEVILTGFPDEPTGDALIYFGEIYYNEEREMGYSEVVIGYNDTYEVPLYQGHMRVSINNPSDFNVTGDIIIDEDYADIIISGNGTIEYVGQ